ncbi:MAG: S24/S26 family peptidase [Oscillospiraceae bacterium]
MPEHKSFKLSEYDDTIRLVLESGGEFRIYPKGTSMLPLIVQGRDSVALIKPSGELKKGDIAFYLRDSGQYVLHRVVRAENGVYSMCGDNQLNIEQGIEQRHIIGVVSKIYRRDKLITPQKLCYRLYVFMWSCFFVRQVYFKLRRLKNGG